MPTTYPPARHLLRDLAATTCLTSPRRAVSVAPLDEGAKNRAGEAGIGFLASLVDVNAALVALVAGRPDWTATADLTLYGVQGMTKGPAVTDCRLVRAGTGTVIVACTVFDGCGLEALEDLLGAGLEDEAELDVGTPLLRVAAGLVTFSRIPARASASSGSFDPTSLVGQIRPPEPGATASSAPLLERLPLRFLDDRGTAELEVNDYVRNSFGAINGGALGLLFQAAAEAAVPGSVAVDLQVHYLAQATVGPARTAVEILRRSKRHTVCAVSAEDVSRPGTVLDLATVTLDTEPGLPKGA